MTTTPESEYKPVVHVSDDWRRIEFPRGIVPPKGGDLYDAATLAQMQAEIAELRDNRAAWVDRAATSDMTAARLAVELSAAKELLRAAKSWINPYRVPIEDEADAKRINERIDAFLQEKP
jgi:hypothetical protein